MKAGVVEQLKKSLDSIGSELKKIKATQQLLIQPKPSQTESNCITTNSVDNENTPLLKQFDLPKTIP